MALRRIDKEVKKIMKNRNKLKKNLSKFRPQINWPHPTNEKDFAFSDDGFLVKDTLTGHSKPITPYSPLKNDQYKLRGKRLAQRLRKVLNNTFCTSRIMVLQNELAFISNYEIYLIKNYLMTEVPLLEMCKSYDEILKIILKRNQS